MAIYTITVFDKAGSKLLDENFDAATEAEAKTKGEELLKEKGYEEYTHRCVSPAGKLVLFHR
ncbi:YhzD family protein [Bacillus sp. AK128]